MADTHDTTERTRIRRHALGVCAGLAGSVAILAFLYFRKGLDGRTLAHEWQRADKSILSATILLSACFHVFVGADKLWRVLRAMQVRVPYPEILRIRLGAGPLRMLVPLKAGDILNVLYFWRHKQMAFGRASGAILFDRGLNALGAIFWLLMGLLMLPGFSVHRQVLLLVGVGAAYVLLVFCRPLQELAIVVAGRLSRKLERFVRGIFAPFQEFSVRAKVFFLAYGLAFQLRPLLVCYALFRAYGVAPPFPHILAYGSVAVLTVHIPGPPVGLGAREAAIVTLFAGAASDSVLFSVGLLMTISVHIVPMILGIPWIGWFLRMLWSAPERGTTDEPSVA